VARDRTWEPEAKPLRLFVAVDLPEQVRARLDQAMDPFRGRIPGARWTRPDAWHVTLKFLGATWPRVVEEVRAAVAASAVAVPSFESALTTIGAFPGPQRARVLWVGLHDPGGRFGPLVQDLDERLEDLFAPEKRGYTPHLTVARLTTPRKLDEFVPDLLDVSVASEPFPVDHLTLYRSHLSPSGARYEPLEMFPLGPAGA
jgi:RNA 2',3'-cyclic 3'-phosphodiesterase